MFPSRRRVWLGGLVVLGALALMGQSCTPPPAVVEFQQMLAGDQCTVSQTYSYFVDATRHAKPNPPVYPRCQGGPLGLELPPGTYNFRYVSGRYNFDTNCGSGNCPDKLRDYIGLAFFDQGQWHEVSIGGLQHCNRGEPCQSGVRERTHHVSDNGGQPNVYFCADYPQSTIAHGNKSGGINVAIDTIACDQTNQPPIAQLSISTGSPVFGNPVTLDGSASHDPDGSIAGWGWEIKDPAGKITQLSGEVVQFTGAVEGTHIVTLAVVDDQGAEATETRSFNNADESLQALIATSGNRVNEPVRLDGSGSIPSGRLTYAWSVRNPSGAAVPVDNANAPLASFVPTTPGAYPITLTVTDNRGRDDSQTVTIDIKANPFSPGDLKEVE